MTNPNKRVLVGMSGGIDSSAVCLLLQQAGYEPVGMTMRVWDLPRQFQDGADEPDFLLRARRLAERLHMEHVTVDVRREFKDGVVASFVQEYLAGRTPNPCVMCNRTFKFRLLEEWADRLDCAYVATGHYVRTRRLGGHTYLLMGDDVRKDQSYFLWQVPQRILQRCLFPLGGMEKPQVRRFLEEQGFVPEARQGESMEVCFVERDYRDFLRQQVPDIDSRVAGGSFVDTTGRKLGTHAGYPFYTVGQRKGLGIALGHPAFVLRINAEKNTVVLGEEKDTYASCLLVEDARVVDEAEFWQNDGLSVRIRYHSRPVPCRVERLEGDARLLVRTGQPVSAVTPGQSAVFYIGERLVGGAVIASQKGLGQYVAQG